MKQVAFQPYKHTHMVIMTQVAELLIKATLERPKDMKDRAEQRLLKEEARMAGVQQTGREFGNGRKEAMNDL